MTPSQSTSEDRRLPGRVEGRTPPRAILSSHSTNLNTSVLGWDLVLGLVAVGLSTSLIGGGPPSTQAQRDIPAA